jgi:hypothetical protein
LTSTWSSPGSGIGFWRASTWPIAVAAIAVEVDMVKVQECSVNKCSCQPGEPVVFARFKVDAMRFLYAKHKQSFHTERKVGALDV